MIRRIVIEGYKSYRTLDLELGPLSVFVGPNGSGKSNLLDAVQLVSNLVTCRNLDEAFRKHRGDALESFFHGDQGYEKLVKRKAVGMTFQVDVRLSDPVMEQVNRRISELRSSMGTDDTERKFVHERNLRYRVTVEALPRTGHLRVAEERLCALRRDGTEKKSRNAFLEPVEERGRARLHLRAESQAHPTYHELGLGHTLVSTPLFEPHHPHITALREELAGWQVYSLDPEAMMNQALAAAPANWIGRRGENLVAFLYNLQRNQPKAFETFQRSLNLVLTGERGIDVKLADDGRLQFSLLKGGLSFAGRLSSGGTLNMIGLLAAVFPVAAGTVVACEEPEHGVHPARLKVVAELLRQASRAGARQVLATTHSPILADHFRDEELFVCSKDEGQTQIAHFEKVDPVLRRPAIVRALQEHARKPATGK